MKREDAGWLVAAMAVGLVLTMGAVQQAGKTGRFQVVTGVVPTGPLGKGSLSMLLDTDTGETRVLAYGDDGLRWTLPTAVDADE